MPSLTFFEDTSFSTANPVLAFSFFLFLSAFASSLSIVHSLIEGMKYASHP